MGRGGGSGGYRGGREGEVEGDHVSVEGIIFLISHVICI